MTSKFRFELGAVVMCNLGADGWKLGKIIALYYREEHWPSEQVAPYQVMLEADHSLIYVPEDDPRLCRAATQADLNIARRMDALAGLSTGLDDVEQEPESMSVTIRSDNDLLVCSDTTTQPGGAYRSGRCHCCNPCPRSWSYVELYSEHYRCAIRNHLKVTRHTLDLGTIQVGASVHRQVTEGLATKEGYAQAATLVRLPPGLSFSDDGILSGEVRFDPHRDDTYTIDFVAVSTADWANDDIGLVRLEVTLVVEGNAPPASFNMTTFTKVQDDAREGAKRILDNLYDAWMQWEHQRLSNRNTCDQMLSDLRQLRALLEVHPRLDGGRWWVQLGGLHMNVHKLLENTLFECELYLGFALTFGDPEVRRLAEQNLDGCYQKRLLEAARFMWMDGAKLMMQGQWHAAVEVFRRAAAKKDGWGWAVNYGDIWLGEASARIVCGVETNSKKSDWLEEVRHLVAKAALRAHESGVFGHNGHPWVLNIREALDAYDDLEDLDADVTDWLEAFKLRTVYWCAQILGGADPFPPKPKPRLEDADWLLRRLRRLS